MHVPISSLHLSHYRFCELTAHMNVAPQVARLREQLEEATIVNAELSKKLKDLEVCVTVCLLYLEPWLLPAYDVNCCLGHHRYPLHYIGSCTRGFPNTNLKVRKPLVEAF